MMLVVMMSSDVLPSMRQYWSGRVFIYAEGRFDLAADSTGISLAKLSKDGRDTTIASVSRFH